jgi:hypothetical protein
MRVIQVLLYTFILIFLLLPAGSAQTDAVNDSYHQEMKEIINTISDKIITGLTDIQNENAKSALVMSGGTLSGENVSEVIDAKVTAIPYAHSSLVIDPDKKVTAAAPIQYQNLVGAYLDDSAVITAQAEKKPILSKILLLKEGFYGISLSYPIFSPDQKYLGYTDITFRPEEFLRQYIIPVIEQSPYDIMILQPDGQMVYETNEEEIGRNALTDPLYADPSVHQAAINLTSEKSGVITYQFWNRNWDKEVNREAVWDTLEYDGQEWRIAMIRDLDREQQEPGLHSQTGTTVSDLNTSITALTVYMDNATEFARKAGIDEACITFNNQSGPFNSDGRYIFAYDMNGTARALPYQPGLVGMNRMNLTDANGLAILPTLIDKARDGGGYLYFVYPNPAHGYTNELKLFLIKPVDETWFIGSGVYLPDIDASISQKNLTELVNRVKEAAIHAKENGKEQALADFNAVNGNFVQGGNYIFAYGYDGTTLVLPYQPELIGTNRSKYTDQFGCRIITMETDAAKQGEGYVYVVYGNPDTGKNELKLCYVTPVGNDWFVGSGIYTGENLI